VFALGCTDPLFRSDGHWHGRSGRRFVALETARSGQERIIVLDIHGPGGRRVIVLELWAGLRWRRVGCGHGFRHR
jgi:hypothetical protein